MSEFTGVGPAVALDGPRPVAPPQSLLNTPGVLVDPDEFDSRVFNGANVWMYPSGCAHLWEPCLDGTFRVKESESTMITQRFDSFVVYNPIICSTFGFGGDSIDELAERALVTHRATLSAGVEKALAAGVASSSNPFFADGNVDVLNSGTAVAPRVGVSFLEEAIGATCRSGLLHLTPAVVAGLPAPLREGESLATANGTLIASGMGYQDVDVSGEPDTTEDWVFATGGVRVYLGPERMTTPKESIDREINEVTFRAETYVLAVWDGVDPTGDTLSAAAVLVDWAT